MCYSKLNKKLAVCSRYNVTYKILKNTERGKLLMLPVTE